MLNNFRRKSLQKRIAKYISNRDMSQVNGTVKTIGFIVDESLINDFEPLFNFFKDLNLQPKDVKVFSFIESKKKLPSLRQDQVYNKDFSWRGELQNENAVEFLNREFDVLIGYYDGSQEFLDYMIARSKAKFKVGFSNADSRLYDLLVAVPIKEHKMLESELKKYLTVLDKI